MNHRRPTQRWPATLPTPWARTHRHPASHARVSLSYLSYLSHGHHTSARRSAPLFPSLPAVLLAPLARTLASDLPTSGTHLPPCHYVVISDNERVSATNPRLHACLRQKWARKQFRPEIRLQTRRAPVNEPLSRSIFQEQGHGTVDNPSMDAPSLDYWPFSFSFSSLLRSSLSGNDARCVVGWVTFSWIIKLSWN